MQEFIVGLIVAYAAWSLLVRYTPKAMRRRIRAQAVHALNRIGMKKLADRIANRDDSDCSSGCASCGGCGPAPRAGGMTPKQSSITPNDLRRTAHAAAIRRTL